MPSASYINFLYLQKDVSDLSATHFKLSPRTPGRRRLGFLTRSAIVMLCAAWERYNEDLLLECIQAISNKIKKADELPVEIQETISSAIKIDKNELSPISITGDGWKTVWSSLATAETEKLNTPKSEQLNLLFSKYLGLPNYSYFWVNSSSVEIDKFVSIRGDIAHKGSHAQYIRLTELKEAVDLVISTAIEIDSSLAIHLKSSYSLHTSPWQTTYPRSLKSYLEDKEFYDMD